MSFAAKYGAAVCAAGWPSSIVRWRVQCGRPGNGPRCVQTRRACRSRYVPQGERLCMRLQSPLVQTPRQKDRRCPLLLSSSYQPQPQRHRLLARRLHYGWLESQVSDVSCGSLGRPAGGGPQLPALDVLDTRPDPEHASVLADCRCQQCLLLANVIPGGWAEAPYGAGRSAVRPTCQALACSG